MPDAIRKDMDRLVFRLRQLPDYADRQDATRILSKALGVDSSAFRIISLAFSVDPLVSSKVATLMFNDIDKVQPILEKEDMRPNITKRGDRGGDEWVIEADLRDPLVLDTHFRGFTPLYDPGSRMKIHMADCIAISGLASHPFGSWQPKGDSKNFMWIRDKLPWSLPNVRPILYGYDTTLIDSHSFQSIFDLALGLIHHLRANGWVSPTCKPLSFLAHSLGGLVVKQAFVLIASRIERDSPIRQAIKGAVFFGVPNFGMEQSHLAVVVKGQPNAELIENLKLDSTYLRQLDEQFSGISYLQNCSLHWGYETQKSPTVAQDSEGQWSRTGPREILVTPESATRGLYEEARNSDTIFPINEDHSGIVKFSQNDPVYPIVVKKLAEILPLGEITAARTNETSTSNLEINATQTVANPQIVSSEGLTHEVILDSLRAPERDHRLEEIEEKFRNTFDWVYDRPEPGFTRWLERGTGLFWINGKPGSGKSTLMKFLFKDSRTSDLLQDWKTGIAFTRVAFFFHYRGSSMQKSFEGLLRSLLSQIISERPVLCRFLRSMFKQKKFLTSGDWTLPILRKGLHTILNQDEEPLHLCLFLDAIDEYDGRLESICQFLQDLGRIPSKPNKQIKVCFSSRPWGIFLKNFKGHAGFRMQDFTQVDIRDYCLGSLAEENLSSIALEALVPYLVSRSRGVFLWVKLVVKDLAKAAGVSRMSKTELETLLGSYPTELDSYYVEIIERIPRIHRWRAYAMLEIAVRSDDILSPKDFMFAVNSSGFRTYQEINDLRQRLHNHAMEAWAAFVSLQSKMYCGGLIEVLFGTEGYYIQVLHQTVEDFVMDSKFKQLILGDQAKITVENGNTFLAKSRFKIHSNELFYGTYGRKSEKTTGRSLKAFLDTVPGHVFYKRPLSSKGVDLEHSTPLAYAAYTGLRLYIIESLAVNPNLIRDSTEPLLSHIVDPESAKMNEGFYETTRLLLDSGFPLHKDPKAFSELVLKLPSRESLDSTFEHPRIQMAELLLNRGQDPNVDILIYDDDADDDGFFRCKPLHYCSVELTKLLLDKGALVNALNSKKRTPLDQCGWDRISDGNWLPGTGENYGTEARRMSLHESYTITCLLVSHGGVIRKLPKSSMKRRLAEFEDRGWPTEEIRARLFPQQSLRETIVSRLKRISSPLGRV
ncbi:hypothetical protein F4818DRAFT_304526 [Hypoxylon cercidicola]|nr:hypothetical protein F4818DRAFT_304526 [Hypoxylon cercidicola]